MPGYRPLRSGMPMRGIPGFSLNDIMPGAWWAGDAPTAPGTLALSHERFAGVALPIFATSTFTKARVRVDTAGNSGAKFRIGIYDADGNLVLDAGQVDTDTTGQKEVAFAEDLVLRPGLYVVGGVPQAVDSPGLRMRGLTADAPTTTPTLFAPRTEFLSTGGFLRSTAAVEGALPATLALSVASSLAAAVVILAVK